MRGFITFATASIALSFALSLPAVAAGAKSNAKAQNRIVDDGYAKTALSLSDEKLPQNFKGYSCTEIVKGLQSLNIKKDEFETKQEFEDRLMNDGLKKLSGSITAADPMIFVYNKSLSDFKYDPESQAFKGRSYFGKDGMLKEGYELFDAAPLVILSNSRKSYIGVNGFGASTKVEESSTKVCGVIFKQAKKKTIYGPLKIEYNIPMASEKARELKDSLKIAFVGALSIPYLGRYVSFSKPTVSSPYDISITGDAIVIRLEEVWVFDEKTGEIFARVQPSE